MKPVLAQSATDTQAERLLTNHEWIAQQKCDGQRILVTVTDGQVQFLNRQGIAKQTMVTPALRAEFERFHIGEWCFDGEMVDGTYWLFDMPRAGEHVSPDDPLAIRLSVLDGLVEQGIFNDSPVLRVLPRAETTEDKIALRDRVRDSGGEGLMLKNLNGRYDCGMRSRHLLKYKFVHTVDCVVLAVDSNGKENLTLGLFKPGHSKPVEVGDCTGRSGDGSAAFKVGVQPDYSDYDVAEVKYLYMGAGGRLYQPTYPLKRDDKAPEECTWDQVVHVQKGVLT